MRFLFFILFAFLIASPTGAVLPAYDATVFQEDIVAQYADPGSARIKILIVPGHEPSYGGTELGALKERDVVVEIAHRLAAHFSSDPRIAVTIARDTKEWNERLERYFDDEWEDIKDFVALHKKQAKRLMKTGDLEDREFEVAHNSAAPDVALRLYGMNRFANENGYDIAIHLHLNDNPGASNHSGFAVYVPDREFGNASASRPLGVAIASELNRFNATSTLPVENYGVVEDQDLIALGAYNTAQFASVLIEYAYIYESKIANPLARPAIIEDMAYQTYRGVRSYLGAPVLGDATLALPRVWQEASLPLGDAGPHVYALQTALSSLGFYPPSGELLIGCPISGYMGVCTKQALRAFQQDQNLEPTGTIGPRTKAALEAVGF